MATEDADARRRARALAAAVDEALADSPDGDRDAALDAVDYRWLGVGARLGLDHPDRARRLLEAMADRPDEGAALAADGAGDSGEPTDPGTVPVRSALLARSAALPPADRSAAGPGAAFGWATRLAPAEVLSIGRVVGDMLAAGAPPDVSRAFALAWDAGVRLPRRELDVMFQEFTELEVTVAGVLTGRDLRAAPPAPPPRTFAARIDRWFARTSPRDAQAAAALESSGESGRRGLVALWNAWAAMRYRSLIPQPTFELLVRPWVTVVGPLPEP